MNKSTCDSDRKDLLLHAIERMQVIWLALHAPQSTDIANSSIAMANIVNEVIKDLEAVHSGLPG